MSITLKDERKFWNAIYQDDNGRYFYWRSGVRIYGFNPEPSRDYVCFTCGRLCECKENL